MARDELRFAKPRSVRLDGLDYWRFKMAVHSADNWRCLICVFFGESGLKPLTVHHLLKRSKLRLDLVTNAISACLQCHEKIERGQLLVSWIDAEKRKMSIVNTCI